MEKNNNQVVQPPTLNLCMFVDAVYLYYMVAIYRLLLWFYLHFMCNRRLYNALTKTTITNLISFLLPIVFVFVHLQFYFEFIWISSLFSTPLFNFCFISTVIDFSQFLVCSAHGLINCHAAPKCCCSDSSFEMCLVVAVCLCVPSVWFWFWLCNSVVK